MFHDIFSANRPESCGHIPLGDAILHGFKKGKDYDIFPHFSLLDRLIMVPVPVPIAGVNTTLLHTQWHGYWEIAATTLVFWDYILTFEGELELIWRRKKNGVSVLFILNRYLAIIAQLVTTYAHVSGNVTYEVRPSFFPCYQLVLDDGVKLTSFDRIRISCKFAIAYWLTGTSMLQLAVTDSIVWLCVCALYANSKRVRWPLLGLMVVCVLSATATLGVVGSEAKGAAEVIPGIKRCTVYTQYHGLWLFWIPIIVYETTTLVLVLRLFILYLRNRKGWASNLMELLLKDMLLYLAVIFIAFVSNAYLFSNPDPSLSGLLNPPTVVFLSILGNRMLLNLRAENKRAVEGVVYRSGVRAAEKTPGDEQTNEGSDRREGPNLPSAGLEPIMFAAGPAESQIRSTTV
ncbi:hypothetical protein D9757_009259 [Collybiopsis confluens]|uniref:DUF6533 domain-containing protein n=1 Tax=Collybiopsis confluens TaxID=2823264 RepID=A0A8H5M3Q4_9AGAR|nr:hypothetical protein D9757_009259 [Collybiopsis confluens]